MARIEVVTGRHAGKGYDLEKAVILGRGETCGIQLPDGKASREHCRVFQQAGKWVVADLNSRNGITVNGAKTTRKNLRNGDRIEVGETTVEFVDAETMAPLAEPGEIDIDVDEIDVEIEVDDGPAAAPAARPKPKRDTSKKDAAFARARADAKSAKSKKAGSGGGGGLQVKDDVLQFNKIDMNTSSPFSFDLSQYSSGVQMAIGGAAVAVFCLIVWGIFKALGVTLT